MVTRAVRSEARVLVAACKSLARRPLEPVVVASGWQRFGAMDTSSYGNFVTMVLLLLVLEMPAVHLILSAVMEPGTLRDIVRSVMLGSSLYVALWLIGDLRLLRETAGVSIGDGLLSVELGVRVNGRVSLADVTDARPAGADGALPSDGTTAIRATPLLRPNCRVRLRAEVCMRGMLGMPLRGDSLDLYVDDPAGLVAAIEAAGRT